MHELQVAPSVVPTPRDIPVCLVLLLPCLKDAFPFEMEK